MSTRIFLRVPVAEFSTRNLDISTHILLVLYSKFRALFQQNKSFEISNHVNCNLLNFLWSMIKKFWFYAHRIKIME
jgi:hypothetical protein